MPRASRSSRRPPPLAVGLDIVEIGRIRKAAMANPAFLKRVFSRAEIAYCMDKKRPWQHFAVRFAAKEAVYKALGAAGVALRSISVARDEAGRPSVLLDGVPEPRIALSLTHSDHYAAAVAVLAPR